MDKKKKSDIDEKMNNFLPLIANKNDSKDKTEGIENGECERWEDVPKAEQNKAKMYVVIYNISKKKNIGCIIRSCVAFNVHKVFIIGNNKKKEVNFFGNMGTHKYINIEFFSNIMELKEYLEKQNILLYGCEITENSIPIVTKPFIRDTAFLFGNEGLGINDNILKYCDKVIYIPQYGNGTSSLNVSISCSIVLHNFAVWANYKETKIKGKKFIIEECMNKRDQYLNPSNTLLQEINQKRLDRINKKENNELVSLEGAFLT